MEPRACQHPRGLCNFNRKVKPSAAPAMKHIAAAAGVSAMTVSLALRRDPSLPAATRERITALAQRMGYRRNPLVSALMAGLRTRRTEGHDANVIAYVESFGPEATPQQAASLARYRAGAAEGAAVHGYRLERFRLGGDGLTEARLEQVLEARGIRGVVFAPLPQIGSVLTRSWRNHALAAVGYSLAQPRLHRAVNHQVHSIRLAITELTALGYRRFGFVVSRHEDARTERNWMSAILLARHEMAGTERSAHLFLEERVERSSLVAWCRAERPEVIVTTEEQIDLMLRRTRGLERLGFAHLHLTQTQRGSAGIDQKNERVGAAAVDLAVEQLHANLYGLPENPKTVLIEGRWERGTTARRK